MDDPQAIVHGEARRQPRVHRERACGPRPVDVETDAGDDLRLRDHRQHRVYPRAGSEVDALDEDTSLADDDVVIVGVRRERVGGVRIDDDVRAGSQEDRA